MADDGYVTVPGHPGLKVYGLTRVDGTAHLDYVGDREALLALGLFSPQVLEPWKKGTPKGRVDNDGDTMRVSRYHGSRAGVPYERFRVTFPGKKMERAVLMPGAREAFALHQILELARMERCRQYNAALQLAEANGKDDPRGYALAAVDRGEERPPAERLH